MDYSFLNVVVGASKLVKFHETLTLVAFSPPEHCRLFAEKGLERGVTGTRLPPLLFPLGMQLQCAK